MTASVGKAIGARRSPMQSTVTVVRWTQRGSWSGVGRGSRVDQLRVFPLWTRPLLAGRSFFDFGVAGRFGPRMSASRFGHRRSSASSGNFTLWNLAIAWRSKTFPPRQVCNDASRNFHCRSFGRCATSAREPLSRRSLDIRGALFSAPWACVCGFHGADRTTGSMGVRPRDESAQSSA